MKINIPYNKLELSLALMGIDQKKLDTIDPKKNFDNIKNSLPKDKAELNKKIADENGISVVDLINSPNYQILCDECIQKMFTNVIETLAKEFNITIVQSWAIFALCKGTI